MNNPDLDALDFEKSFLQDCLVLIDSRKQKLESLVSTDGPEPDCFIYDPMDHILGVGFVAAQRYIVSVCGWFNVNKRHAFQLGPKHKSGVPIAEIVNSTANYWKHAEEPGSTIHLPTRTTLEAIGMEVPSTYLVSNVLNEIGLKRSLELLPLLVEWRDAVIAYALHRPTE